jgi:AcrR family transcriptional regulator
VSRAPKESRRATTVRQAELTDAALHIVATRGIAGLTTRALAERVGLTSGAIFRHFPTLDALLQAVAERAETVLDATFPDEAAPPLERLRRFVEARSQAVGQSAGILRLVLSEQFVIALPREASARLARCVDKTRRFVVACVTEGQAAGTIRQDVPVSALSAVVLGTIQMLALARTGPHEKGFAGQTEVVREGLFALLAPVPTAASRKRVR